MKGIRVVVEGPRKVGKTTLAEVIGSAILELSRRSDPSGEREFPDIVDYFYTNEMGDDDFNPDMDKASLQQAAETLRGVRIDLIERTISGEEE